jgi:beta-glucosidase
MRSADQQPINDGDGKTPLFAYGYGLTYGAAPADTVAPSVPGTPAAADVTATGLTLTWPASTDTGGSGLAGYDIYRDGTAVGSSTAASYAATGLSPATRYEFSVVARDGAGNRSARSAALAVTTSAGGGTGTGSCRVSYSTSDWSTGFTGSVSVTNTGTTAVNPWRLEWSFTVGQKITQGWSAKVTQSGAVVTAAGEAWNPSLAPGATATFGFNGSHTGSNPRPAAFTLNGNVCTN